MAEEYGIKGFACPAGGCLLTDQNFSAKLRDLFAHRDMVGMRDIGLLKIGRHFRFGTCKIVCARDEAESDALRRRGGDNTFLFEVLECMGPVVLLEGEARAGEVRQAAEVAAAYSDGKEPSVSVKYWSSQSEQVISVMRPARDTLESYRIQPRKTG